MNVGWLRPADRRVANSDEVSMGERPRVGEARRGIGGGPAPAAVSFLGFISREGRVFPAGVLATRPRDRTASASGES